MKIPNHFNKLGVSTPKSQTIDLSNGLYLYHPLNDVSDNQILPTGQSVVKNGSPTLVEVNGKIMTYFNSSSGNYYKISDTAGKVIAQPFSMSWHFTRPPSPTYDEGFVGQNSGINQFRLVYIKGHNVIQVTFTTDSDGTKNGRIYSREIIEPTTQIISCVINVSNGIEKIYINGVYDNEVVFYPESFTIKSYDLIIGRFRTTASTRFTGYMSDFRIHQRILTDEEIKYHSDYKC